MKGRQSHDSPASSTMSPRQPSPFIAKTIESLERYSGKTASEQSPSHVVAYDVAQRSSPRGYNTVQKVKATEADAKIRLINTDIGGKLDSQEKTLESVLNVEENKAPSAIIEEVNRNEFNIIPFSMNNRRSLKPKADVDSNREALAVSKDSTNSKQPYFLHDSKTELGLPQDRLADVMNAADKIGEVALHDASSRLDSAAARVSRKGVCRVEE